MFGILLGVLPFGSIFSWITSNWKLVVTLVVAIAIGIFVWSWDARGKQVLVLQQQSATLKANIVTIQAEADMRAAADADAAAYAAAAAKKNITINQISQDAHNAKPSDDAPIAPVLRHSLDAVAGLQHANGH